MDTINPGTLMEFQEKINAIRTYCNDMQNLLNALEGAYVYWQRKKDREQDLEALMAVQGAPEA